MEREAGICSERRSRAQEAPEMDGQAPREPEGLGDARAQTSTTQLAPKTRRGVLVGGLGALSAIALLHPTRAPANAARGLRQQRAQGARRSCRSLRGSQPPSEARSRASRSRSRTARSRSPQECAFAPGRSTGACPGRYSTCVKVSASRSRSTTAARWRTRSTFTQLAWRRAGTSGTSRRASP